MSDPITAAVAWLAASDAPNILLIIALLTSPWKWSDALHKRLSAVLDTMLPSGREGGTAETPDEDPRE